MRIRSIVRNFVFSPVRSIFSALFCFAYRFGGVNDYGQFASRLIDPDGDNTIEFWPPTNINGAIISQNIQTTVSLTEFVLFTGSSGELRLTFGGSGTTIATIAQGYEPGFRYKLVLSGTGFSLFKNGVSLRTGTFTRGAAREPTATTKLFARTNGSSGVNLLGAGLCPEIKVNSRYYAIDQKESALQPSLPAGNDLTLINSNAERWQEIPCSTRLDQNAMLTPVITSQPSDQSVSSGDSASFSVSASVELGSLAYQWQVNTGAGFFDIPAQTSSTLSLPSVSIANNGSFYRVQVTANSRFVFSRSALLTVSAAGGDGFLASGAMYDNSELSDGAELYT